MKPLVNTENPLILRADFSSKRIWEEVCADIRNPVFGFRANVEYLDDPSYDGITEDQLRNLIPKNYQHCFIILVDLAAITQKDHPLLVVDLSEEENRSFRAVPSTVQSIADNLPIGNMDFTEFANSVDESGVFRGFFKHRWG